MNELDRRFWPFKPRASIAATILTLVALVVVLIILQGTLSWPDRPGLVGNTPTRIARWYGTTEETRQAGFRSQRQGN
jgi:hypothetical protein